MTLKYLDILRACVCVPWAARPRHSVAAVFFAATTLAFAAGPAALADEESASPASPASSANSGSGDLMICVREQNLLGGYGPERCFSHATLTSGIVDRGFGSRAYWVGDRQRSALATTHYRFRETHARPEFLAIDIEAEARSRAPAAIWMLSYNIRDLASTLPDPEQHWTYMRLDGHQSIGLSALDPGIERNPTGLLAIGLRISLAY